MNRLNYSYYYVANPTSSIYKTPTELNETYFELPLCGEFCPAQQEEYDKLEDKVKISPIYNNLKGGSNDNCCGGYFN